MRPTNADLYNKAVDIERGTDVAVATVMAAYPNTKVLSAEVHGEEDGEPDGYVVTLGWQEETGTHILEVGVAADGTTITGSHERPNVPPGWMKDQHGKKAKKESQPPAEE
jgi:hypothetical protein